MTRYDLRDFNRKSYDYEAARRHNLAIYLPLRITLVGLLFSGFLAAVYRYKDQLQCLTIPEWALIAASLVSLLIAFIFILRFQLGHYYYYIADARAVETYRSDLFLFYRRKNRAEEEALKYINREYIECAALNCAANDRKTAFLTLADTSLAIAAIFVAILYVVSFNMDMLSKEITKQPSERSKMETDETPSPPPTSTDQKPSPPPRRVIQENSVPRKPAEKRGQ
jgi:hypothetical protein